MNWKILLICLMLIVSGQRAEAFTKENVDGMLTMLDKAISEHGRYKDVREARIVRLKQQLSLVDTTSADFFRWNGEIYKEYQAYLCDSALHYLNRNLRWAERQRDKVRADETRLELVYLMASTGMYQEASELLGQVRRSALPDSLLAGYYRSSWRLYCESMLYTQDPSFRHRYRQQALCYEDSLRQVLDPNSALGLEKAEAQWRGKGKWEEALEVNKVRMDRTKPDTPEYALVTYQRSLSSQWPYVDEEDEKYWLAVSALTDIRLAITDHASLWNLAERLYEEGDIERAYRYIRFSWAETNRYNARSRSLQTAGILSLIDLTYQALQEKQSEKLRLSLLLISTLTLLLVVAFFFISSQIKHLSVAHRHLGQVNGRLEETNEQLEQANSQLEMSNRIKEVYLGRFMSLCSVNVKRLEAYRKVVYNKVVTGQTNELLHMMDSRQVLDSGWRELYQNFDSAFLDLFPNFVEKFNEMLLPEERIVLRKTQLLNTELRIFALIRLGITDSSQIAEFLRCSVNTVYNYRATVKNRSRVPREDFESCLMLIR